MIVRNLIHRPIAVTMCLIALIAIGCISFKYIPVSLMPDIDIPQITVQVSYPGATVHEVDAEVVAPLRSQLMQVAGLKDIINPTGMSMTDKERLDIINRIYGEVLEYKNLTWYYTRKNIGISYLRSKKKGDSQRVLALYGTHEQRYW